MIYTIAQKFAWQLSRFFCWMIATSSVVCGWLWGEVGSVKTLKQIEVWSDLPRSKVDKVLKAEIKLRLLAKTN